MALESESIRVPKLSHVVAERLRGQIVRGDIQIGDRLPPEGELAETYRISRPTLREALRILEAEQLIFVARGNRLGAYVLGPTVDRAAQYAAHVLVASRTTLADVHEARLLIEPSVVRSLAARSDRSRIAKDLTMFIHASASALKADKFEQALDAINGFHTQLVRSSGNQTLMLLTGLLANFSEQAHAEALLQDRRADAVVRNMEKTMQSLKKVTELIAAGDAAEAESFWRYHMERAYDFFLRTGLGSRPLLHRSDAS
jgi:DNA-binding FadR family transcriptional regulator